jgi:hypothetical protein
MIKKFDANPLDESRALLVCAPCDAGLWVVGVGHSSLDPGVNPGMSPESACALQGFFPAVHSLRRSLCGLCRG